MLDPSTIRAVTFDCYGTLVDWEAGIRAHVAPHLEREGDAAPTVEAWLARWEEVQFGLLAPGRPYREILVESYAETMRAFAMPTFADGAHGIVRSLAEWPAFSDTVPSLRKIARGRRVGIVSNIDRDLMAETLGRLLVPLSMVVTAEEAGAYKPDPAPLRLALERLGLAPEEVLHAAFGWRYDLATARSLGMRTAWIRRKDVPRPPGEPAADLELPSLTALADALI